MDMPWLNSVNRPAQKRRIPSVLTRAEIASLFQFLDGELAPLAKLLYGTGMGLMEGLRLRIRDVDFDRQLTIVRKTNGGKGRELMLPQTLAPVLRQQQIQPCAQGGGRGGTASPLDALTVSV
jgi:integrase